MATLKTSDQRATKEFQHNGFVVMVPLPILKAWEAAIDKQREIINSLRAHYNTLRNEPITEGVGFTLEFGGVPGEPLSKTAEKMANPGVKKAVLKLLKYEHYRDWHLSPIRDHFVRAVTMAALDGDKKFFKVLGERLKRPCKTGPTISELNKLLLLNWIGTKDTEICFCWFSFRALQDFIRRTGKGTKYELDAIKKAVNRQLKLPKLRPALVRSINQDGKQIVLGTDRPIVVPDMEGLEPRAQETDAARTLRAERAKK